MSRSKIVRLPKECASMCVYITKIKEIDTALLDLIVETTVFECV